MRFSLFSDPLLLRRTTTDDVVSVLLQVVTDGTDYVIFRKHDRNLAPVLLKAEDLLHPLVVLERSVDRLKTTATVSDVSA